MPIHGGGGSGAGGGTPGDPGTNKVWGSNGAGAALGVLPPGFEINYTQITAGVNIVSTTEATPTTIISPGAITFDGSAVRVEFFSYGVVSPAVQGGASVILLFEGATEITRLAVVISPAAVNLEAPVYAAFRFTPTAGSHTYTIAARATSTTGTPTVEAGAGGTATPPPAFVRFTKV
jgi:hypothetical protein